MTPAQRNAKKAMKLYHSGQASSLKQAWRMVKGGKANPKKRKNTRKRKNPTFSQVTHLLKQPKNKIERKILIELGRSRYWSITYKDGSFQHIPVTKTGKPVSEIQRKRKNTRKRKNAGHSDPDAIQDILLSVTNDGNFYEQVLKPTVRNLGRHMYRGNFTRAGAMKSFLRVANLADKFYNSSLSAQRRRTWQSTKGYLLSAADRKKLAAEMLEEKMYLIEDFADQMQAGVKYKDLNNNPHCMPNPRKRTLIPSKLEKNLIRAFAQMKKHFERKGMKIFDDNNFNYAYSERIGEMWYPSPRDIRKETQASKAKGAIYPIELEVLGAYDTEGAYFSLAADLMKDGTLANVREQVENPRRRRNTRKANPRRRKNSAAQKRAQSNASKAMKLYQSGKAKSLKAAWRMVKRGS